MWARAKTGHLDANCCFILELLNDGCGGGSNARTKLRVQGDTLKTLELQTCPTLELSLNPYL